MKKVLLVCLSFILTLSCLGCVNEKKLKENIDNVEQKVEPSKPENVSEHEKKEDEIFNSMADDSQKVYVKELKGQYCIVLLSTSGYPIVKGTEEWTDIFGEEESLDDTISFEIKDKNHLIINSYGDISKITYILEGNVMKWVADDEELDVAEALIVDGCIVVDLNDSKMYFSKIDDPEGIKKAIKVCKKIESDETVVIENLDKVNADEVKEDEELVEVVEEKKSKE